METGTKISLTAHSALILLALFGGPLFDSDESNAIQISEVSIVTSGEFEAMMSASPQPQFEVPEQSLPASETETALAPVEESAPEVPEQSAVEKPATPDASPDVNALNVPEQPELEVETPNLADQANDSVGSTLIVPDSPVSDQETDGQRQPDQLALLQPKPRPAPRIDTTEAPKPEIDAETAQETVEATTPDVTATEQVEEAEEAAPKESATEIVTDPVDDPNSAAPAKSSRPRGRPSDIAAKADKARKDTAEAAVAAQREAEAKAIEEALKQATNEADTPKPSGPPLTSSEKNGLVLAVQECWNVPVGVQNARDLVVVLAVELTPDGKLAGSPKLIEPSGTPEGTVRQAFEAGRRALIRCAPYSLPREKYEQWRQLEVAFNPQKMVVK
ncbi:MAG: hypothetical protein GY952_09880 [Rhodobacteraceae bacterium]|nr:hypothetical protein [Paracoccaceae bacterium]